MKKKKVLSLVVVAAMALSLAACGSNSTSSAEATMEEEDQASSGETGGEATEEVDISAEGEEETEALEEVDAEGGEDVEVSEDSSDYDSVSASIYDEQFGQFYDAYENALSADSVSERYALMAQSEAYLLETGATTPLTMMTGRYAISRVAPKTNSTVLWGSDYERYHQVLVTTEFITADDRATMKEQWSELKGSGTYEEWAKSYLEEQGYTLKDEYNYTYNADPATWDILSSSLSVDAEALINTYDGLVEYDIENELQPALAESWDVSDDGTQYTFHLREGVSWVDSQGREVGEVTADDFVAGMQHMMDAAGGLEYLVGEEGCNIVNADAYVYGEVTDFSEVGVEAVDDYTLVYTLEEPCSFFMTMLGYSVFAPMNRDYYVSQGGKFGYEYDNSASDYTYGTDPDHIAYCGPYLVTNATSENKIVFSANDSYWNADGINVSTITWTYEDGSDPTKAYNDLVSGVLDYNNLNTSTLELAKSDGNFDKYAYITDSDATTYQSYMNLNRNAYANTNDDTAVVSTMTQDEISRTDVAVQNQNFRLAVDFAFDRATYNEQAVGEDLKEISLRNMITPGDFVALEEDVSIDINGEETSFPAGTNYGEIVQAQLDADGVPITAYDASADDGVGSSDGYDGWYNVNNANQYLDQAIEELSAQGVDIDEDNPIYLDLPYASNVEVYTNKANAYKQSVEESLGGKVIINLVECVDTDEWMYTGYFCDYGYEMNYNLFDLSGWAPDYGDPSTYLGCYLPDYAGYMCKCFGIY